MSRVEKQERSILTSFSKSVGKHPFRQYSHGSPTSLAGKVALVTGASRGIQP
jgi:hypothetical protein